MYQPGPNSSSAESYCTSTNTVESSGETDTAPTDIDQRENRPDAPNTKATLGRRSYLSLLGIGVAAPVLGSQTVHADTTQGYGVGGYGLGEYGVDEPVESPTDPDDGEESTAPTVYTVSTDERTATSVRLGGYVYSIDTEESTLVYFEYRQTNTDQWKQTESEQLGEWGAFKHTVSQLSPSTTYEYRAVAERGDHIAVGETETFSTLTSETASPVVDRLSAEDVSPPNPHVDLAVDWHVSDADGDLETVTLMVSDYQQTLRWEQISVDGETASGTEEFSIRHGANKTYVVTLSVIDAAGNQTTKKEQLAL